MNVFQVKFSFSKSLKMKRVIFTWVIFFRENREVVCKKIENVWSDRDIIVLFWIDTSSKHNEFIDEYSISLNPSTGGRPLIGDPKLMNKCHTSQGKNLFKINSCDIFSPWKETSASEKEKKLIFELTEVWIRLRFNGEKRFNSLHLSLKWSEKIKVSQICSSFSIIIRFGASSLWYWKCL